MTAQAYIGLLYKIEQRANGRPSGKRLALRQRNSVPVLGELRTFLECEQQRVLPKSPEGGAIAYTQNNWAALCRCAADGDLEIDNNAAERSLRGVAVGRKNWMLFGSDEGGRTVAILTSFMVTCQCLQIDPFAYLRDVLTRTASHPATKLDELRPSNWKPASAQLDPQTLTGHTQNHQARQHGLTGRVRKTFTFSQSGAPCTCTVIPDNRDFGAEGGIGTVSVQAPTGCSWTATSLQLWVTIDEGTSGNGPGSVRYTVYETTGSARNATLAIAGQAFTVNQAGVAPGKTANAGVFRDTRGLSAEQ